MRRAVIDVGSNSVLLLISERKDSRWLPVRETSRVTGLGTGVKTTGLIEPEAAQRTLRALRDAFELAWSEGVDHIVAAGTMALRIAKNAGDFLARAESQGTPVQVLSGDEEAELGWRSVSDDPIFATSNQLTVIDVGGHSTELVNVAQSPDGWRVRYRKSHPVGTLGLRDHRLANESPTALDLLQAAAEIDDLVGTCFLPGACGTVVALGASATNLVAIRDAMTEWDPDKVHGQVLSYEEISRSVTWLSAMSDPERADLVGIEPGRESTIHLGALLLERFLFAARAEETRVSVRGWRHALLESL